MGIFKLGILILILTLFIILPTTLINSYRTQSQTTHSILGASEKEALASNNNVNLTLTPQDQLDVIPGIIIEVIDINTVRILLNDGMEIVDLIGIKVPTSTSQRRFESCYGKSIETKIQQISLGKKVFMIDDKRYENSDTSLKYIFLEDLTFLNLELIKQGITSAIIDYDYLYLEDFAKARLDAENTSVGVWHDTCPISPTPTLQPKTKNNLILNPTTANPYAHLIPSPSPTTTPTPVPPTPTVLPQEKNLSANSSTTSKPASLNPEILFVLINNHRSSIGKPAFEKEDRLCQLAKERGPELYNEIFVTRNVHAGLTNRNLPYWITENMAHYSSEEQVFNWWMGSTIHRKAIESDHKYSCGECYGNSCAQLFTSWTLK